MELQELSDRFAEVQPGQVWLVGAGPGDIGLLTLSALKAIQSADCLIYDALINPQILDLASEETEKIYSGKRGGKPSPQQKDISLKLVELARAGKRVVRLKGGDPFVFGRGGEEALALVKYRIPFKVIPGITSGVAGPAYAGIPITHRDYNSVVSFITGHNANDDEIDKVDWTTLATTGGTLVLYMTLHRLDLIAHKLIDGGRCKQEPVALVSNATTDKQSVLETSLEKCKSYSEDWNIATPCIVIIGKNVTLRSQLNWLANQVKTE